MKYLEQYYGIDFNELEENRLQNRYDKMNKINKTMNNGNTVNFEAGKYEIGVDLSDGKYTLKIPENEKNYYFNIIRIFNESGATVDRFYLSEGNDFKVITLNKGQMLNLKENTEISKVL